MKFFDLKLPLPSAFILTFLLASVTSSPVFAQNTLTQNNNDPFSNSQGAVQASPQQWDLSVLDDDDEENTPVELADIIADTEDFLPVDEAYQLTVKRTEAGIEANWVIADAYFLYGEQFRFLANGQSLSAQLPQGKVAYDQFFEKDVEKHYIFVNALIPNNELPQLPGFELAITSQGCADAGLCYPPNTLYYSVSGDSISLIEQLTPTPAASQSGNGNSLSNTPQPASLSKILSMLILAVVGGMILNLMPCVLPVLSLKALSIASSEGNHRTQGWSYTLGVITTFVLVAAVLLAVRAAGQAVGWGFQLQSPSFVVLLVVLFFVMGLALSGYINLGSSWMSAGQSLTQGKGLQQSFFTGVLAAVVASPCTAPFMASALGFAITQEWWVALSIFAGLGLGMALPLLLLSYLPQLERWLPKPGAWMETFKQALAFPLYITAIWLLWVLGRQLGIDVVAITILGCLLILFVFWLGQHWSKARSIGALASLIIAAALSWQFSQVETSNSATATKTDDSPWESYDESRLSELRTQGKAVFINLTADWCITCKWNEKIVFTDDRMETMKDKGIVLVKGDWTNYDATITRLLERYGRGGVPLYLLFPANTSADAKVLPQILKPDTFDLEIEAI